MLGIENRPVSPLVGRVLGLFLIGAGIAAGWAVVSDWLGPPSPSRAGPLVFYPLLAAVALIVLVALVQGIRMVLAARGSDLSLPNAILVLGVVLLLVGAALEVVLWFVAREVSDVRTGFVCGVGGAIAVQLLRERARTRTETKDGA